MRTRVFAVLCALLLGVVPSFAASVKGRVTDATGAALPDARVVVRSVASGQETDAVTGADGTFEIADVAVGSYGFAVRPKRTWFVTMGTDRCCPTLEAGGAYDIGALELDKVE